MARPESPRILLLEDEPNLGSTLTERLRADGFTLEWVTHCAAARQQVKTQSFDLAILDVSLPDGSGFEIAQLLRLEHPATAIVFLTAYGSPEDRVRGLELGAEDYVPKPFHYAELKLRLQNALKRSLYLKSGVEGRPLTQLRIGEADVYFTRFEVIRQGAAHALTHKECALLKLLVERRGQVVSRDDILNHCWSEEEFPTPRTVDNFISRLRKLVEENPEQPRWIRSHRGVGYQLVKE